MNDLMMFLHFLESAMYQKVDHSRPPVMAAVNDMLSIGVDPKDVIILLHGLAGDLRRSADILSNDVNVC